MSKTKPALADPASLRVVLHHRGSARNVAAPARDLTAADLARLAYREAARDGLADGRRPDPRHPDQDLASAIAERLVASGAYSFDPPAPAAAPTPAAESAATTEG